MPQSRKIAILGTRGIPAAYGGFETFAEEISVRLVAAGHEVTVFCEDAESRQSSYKGVALKYVKAPKLGPLTTIIFDLLCLLRCIRGYDVVYMLGYGASPFCFLPRLTGTKVWINMDGLEWKRSKWSPIAKTWLRITENIARFTASRLIADAQAIADDLATRYRYLPPVSTIAYGAPVVETAPSADALDNYGITPNDYYLVVCRLEPENHVAEIIDGFLAAATSKPLIVIGDHKADNAYVHDLVTRQCDRVRFIGTVYDPPVLQALRYHAFAYFHGHSVGGTNPSLLEALGSGNCIIAHDNVFNREVTKNAANYFADPKDIPALIAFREMDSRSPEETRKAAQKIITSQYSWELIADHYISLISHEFQDT